MQYIILLTAHLLFLPFFHTAMAAPVDSQQAKASSNVVDNTAKGDIAGVAMQNRQSAMPAFVLEYGLSSL